MSHSRIFQFLTERPCEGWHGMNESDFLENNKFLGPIADNISENCNRKQDFMYLVDYMGTKLGKDVSKFFSWFYADESTNNSNLPEAYVIFHASFKLAYFQNSFNLFKERVSALTLEDFASDTRHQQLKETLEDIYSYYIFDPNSCVGSLDCFIRNLQNDKDIKL